MASPTFERSSPGEHHITGQTRRDQRPVENMAATTKTFDEGIEQQPPGSGKRAGEFYQIEPGLTGPPLAKGQKTGGNKQRLRRRETAGC